MPYPFFVFTPISSPLSLTGKRWDIRRREPVPDIISLLRAERGMDGTSQKISDPFLFPEMPRAVDRIRRALMQKENVAIFGDYDADGITGTAQLVRWFRRNDTEPIVYLPDRLKDGYGLKKHSIDALVERGATLLITVDTGISAHEEIAHAIARGMDVIVTDHHRVQGGRPPALAVIHPMIPVEFPNPHLSGSGVAFMLVRALENGSRGTSLASAVPWEGMDIDIALATIGTIGDLVPLTGENRTLVIHGLRGMASLPASPLKNLLDSVMNGASLTSGDIAFRVVPRINAAGRMAHPNVALQALLDGGAALEELHRLNGDRQSIVEDVYAEIAPLICKEDTFLVVWSDRITPGIAGLIASRLTEKFGRPSLVAAVLPSLAVASIRSVPKIDATQCLEHPSVRPLLLSFGGHAQAAGCTFHAEHAEALRTALNATVVLRNIQKEDLVPSVNIDAMLSSPAVDISFAKSLLSLAPFGQGNTEPTFLLSKQTLTDLRAVGADGTHLQCRVGGTKAIAFKLGSLMNKLGQPVDIACRIGVNSWNGRENVQLVIEDVRVSV